MKFEKSISREEYRRRGNHNLICHCHTRCHITAFTSYGILFFVKIGWDHVGGVPRAAIPRPCDHCLLSALPTRNRIDVICKISSMCARVCLFERLYVFCPLAFLSRLIWPCLRVSVVCSPHCLCHIGRACHRHTSSHLARERARTHPSPPFGVASPRKARTFG